MRPVFVSGTGRSGTSVTRRVLARHPDVAAVRGELRLITDPGGLLDLWEAFQLGRWDPYKADHAIETFRRLVNGHQHLTDAWVLDDDGMRDHLRIITEDLVDELCYAETSHGWAGSFRDHMYETVQHDVRPALRRWVDRLYHRVNPDATHIVDDTPYNALHVHRLTVVFERPAFLSVFRHPLDILSSWVEGKHPWTPTDAHVAATRIAETYRVIRHQTSVPVAMTITVEEMVDRPEEVFGEVCKWAGLEVKDPATNLRYLTAPVDADAAHVGRRDQLTPVQECIGREILAPMMEDLGYE